MILMIIITIIIIMIIMSTIIIIIIILIIIIVHMMICYLLRPELAARAQPTVAKGKFKHIVISIIITIIIIILIIIILILGMEQASSIDQQLLEKGGYSHIYTSGPQVYSICMMEKLGIIIIINIMKNATSFL